MDPVVISALNTLITSQLNNVYKFDSMTYSALLMVSAFFDKNN